MDLVALTSMLLDHVGYFLLPDVWLLRVAGRFALPAYCWLTWDGVGRSRSPWMYAGRVLMVGLCAVPAWWLAGVVRCNVCFGLAAGAVAVLVMRRRLWVGVVVGGGLSLVLWSVGAEYGGLPVLAVMGFELGPRSGWGLWSALNGVSAFGMGNPVQVLAGGASAFGVVGCRRVVRWPRWFWLWFYPVHVGVLALFSWFV